MNGEKLTFKHDTREEAQFYDDYAVGIYLDEGEGIEMKLVGYVLIEISFLLCKIFSPKGVSSRVFSNWIKALGRRTCGSW